MKRKWFSLFDLIPLFVVLAVTLCGVFFLRTRERGDVASVFCENTCVFSVSLSTLSEPFTYTVTVGGRQIEILFEKEGVSVTHSDCPDDVCKRTGRIERAGESILCAPLGVCITLSGEGALDGVTG